MKPGELADIILQILNSAAESSGNIVSENSRNELEKALASAINDKTEDYRRIEEIIGGINISEIEDHVNEISNLYIELGRIGIWNAGFGAAAYDLVYKN